MKSSSSKRGQSDVIAEENPVKRQKTDNTSSGENWSRPKSKKELRQELKAALKAKAAASAVNGRVNVKEADEGEHHRRQREEKRRERKAREEQKERALEARYREQDQMKLARQQGQQQGSTEEHKRGNSPVKTSSRKKTNSEPERHVKKETKKPKKVDEQKQKENGDLVVFKSLFKKSTDPSTGATTCRLGVQYVDVKVGTGPTVQKKSLVTVKYQLRGGSPNGPLLDSSKRFKFRLGKGEVIQGWEIGLEGMKPGGVRHLIVPPKAGYGSQDIGAGSGAMLHFVITMLEVHSSPVVRLGR